MIYYKIDWFQGMFQNTSLSQAAALFGLQDGFDAFLAKDDDPYVRSCAYGSKLVYELNGIRFVVDKALIDIHKSLDDSFDWYNDPLDKFGLEISGTGLDNLRKDGFDVETKLLDPEWIGADVLQFRPTRADFAFDFVNVFPRFMPDLVEFCEKQSFLGCLRLDNGRRGGVSYSVHHSPAEMTAYLGCTRSDYLLRCYDKKLQLDPLGTDPSVYPEQFKQDGEVESWFRIELQTRRETTVQCLYQSLQFRKLVEDRLQHRFDVQSPLAYILAFVKDRFLIRHNGNVVPFMDELFDWDKLPTMYKSQILYNEEKQTVLTSLPKWYRRNWRKLVLFVSVYGYPKLFELLNSDLSRIQMDLDNVQHARQFSAFVRDLAAVVSEGTPRELLHLEDVTGNMILLKKEFELK